MIVTLERNGLITVNPASPEGSKYSLFPKISLSWTGSESTSHNQCRGASWSACTACPLYDGDNACPILENRRRLQDSADEAVFQKRLTALVELSEQNGVHFPVRQLLALATNSLLGYLTLEGRPRVPTLAIT
jgi:hypothetical protein